MQKAEARGENSSGGLITAESGRSRPGSSASLSVLALVLPKTGRANYIPVAAVAVVGKYSTRTILRQSKAVLLLSWKNTVRETNGASESWSFCLLLPLKKKGRGEDGTGVRSGVTVALLPPPLCFLI